MRMIAPEAVGLGFRWKKDLYSDFERSLLSIVVAGLLLCVLGRGQILADEVTSGQCSPIVVSQAGVIRIEIECKSEYVTNFKYTIGSEAQQSLSKYYAVNEIAIHNFFAQLNKENTPPYLVPQRLEKLVVEIKRLRSELDKVAVSTSVQDVRKEVIEALDNGNIEEAISSYKRLIGATESELQRAFATLIDASRALDSLGNLFVLTRKYDEAIKQFKDALDILPQSAIVEQVRVKTDLADAMWLAGEDPLEILKLANEAAEALSPYAAEESELNLRTRGIQLETMVQHEPKLAITFFEKKVSPLLARPDLQSSVWTLFCFSCVGEAFMQTDQNDSAVKVLEQGKTLMDKMILPDKVAQAALLHNLSSAYHAAGNNDRAEVEAEAARSALLSAFPDLRHPLFMQIFWNIGQLGDERSKETNYFKAFEIAAKLFPHIHPKYRAALKRVAVREPFPFVRNVWFYNPPADLIAKAYETDLNKVRSASQGNLELVAEESNYFANMLLEGDMEDEAAKYFIKTVELFNQSSLSCNLATALFFSGLLRPSEGELRQQSWIRSLQIFRSCDGDLGARSRVVRFELVKLYVANRELDKAKALVTEFKNYANQSPKSGEIQTYTSQLDAQLRHKRKP